MMLSVTGSVATLSGCVTGGVEDGVEDEDLSAEAASTQVNPVAIKERLMKSSLVPLANLANALGYGWVSGCGSTRPGDGYHLDLPTEGTAAWLPYNNPNATCDGFMAHDRTKIEYSHWRTKQRDISYGKPTTTADHVKEVDQIIFGASTKAYTANPKKTYSLTTTTEHREIDTVRAGIEFGVEFAAAPFGIGGKSTLKVTGGYEHSWNNAKISSSTSTTDASASFAVPAGKKLIVRIFRHETTTEVPYTASIAILSDVVFSGFLRWQACGGNWHINHRGSEDRPHVDFRIGDGESTPFWAEARQDRDHNAAPFDWDAMMNNKECFDHGAVVNSAIRALDASFQTGNQNKFTFRGKLARIKGTTIEMRPEFVNP